MANKQPTQGQIKGFWEWCLGKTTKMRTGFWDECGDFIEMQSNPYNPRGRGVKALCYLEESRELTTKEATEYQADFEKGIAKWLPVNSEIWQLVPNIDLNNLFKYAVGGKLKEMKLRLEHSVDYGDIDWGREQKHYYSIFKGAHYLLASAEDKVNELALFWALWQVKEVKNGRKDNIG